MVNKTAQTIRVGLIGTIDAENRHSNGCSMVEFEYNYTY